MTLAAQFTENKICRVAALIVLPNSNKLFPSCADSHMISRPGRRSLRDDLAGYAATYCAALFRNGSVVEELEINHDLQELLTNLYLTSIRRELLDKSCLD